jgi:hypothetical protein
LDWEKAQREERRRRQSGRVLADGHQIRSPKFELENSTRFEPMDLNLAKKRWR